MIYQFTKDMYVSEMMACLSKIFHFHIPYLKLKSKNDIEDRIIKDLFDNFSDVPFDEYKLITNDLRRLNIIETALEKRELILRQSFDTTAETQSHHLYDVGIDKNIFKRFLDYFTDDQSTAWNWHSVSKDNNLNWDKDILEKGKMVWDWLEIQLNPALSYYFTDFDLIAKYQNLLMWDIISCDKRLKWNSSTILFFQERLSFSLVWNERITHKTNLNFIQRSFINAGQPCGLSLSPFLSKEIIINHIHLWDWQYLSSNPAILIDDFFLENHLKDINQYGLSHNKGLTIFHLRFLKRLYLTMDNEQGHQKIRYKGDHIYWNFSWLYAFENASVNWKIQNIEEFISILDEKSPYGGYNWWGISKNLRDKEVIIKYHDRLSLFNLVFENPEITWDSELTQLLIDSGLSLNTNEFSKGLPNLFQQINITKDAIIAHKEYWNTNYTYSYSWWHGDEKEETTTQYPLWDILKENKNIVWDTELDELIKSN